MKTRAKNWTIRPYLDSVHWIEEESTILVTDTFCVLTSVIGNCTEFVAMIFYLFFRVQVTNWTEMIHMISWPVNDRPPVVINKNLDWAEVGNFEFRNNHATNTVTCVSCPLVRWPSRDAECGAGFLGEKAAVTQGQYKRRPAVLTYLLTYSMEQSISWEANRF
jgi:hypothetical protein